ncbi:MAG: homoserine kinase, partial [Nocardioidaceae bacterium]
STARGLLPAEVSHADASANSARTALLLAGLTQRPELLLPGTADLLHQQYRRTAMAPSLALVEALRERGVPAVISGAGPTVLAFCTAATAPEVRGCGPSGWHARVLEVDSSGAQPVPATSTR